MVEGLRLRAVVGREPRRVSEQRRARWKAGSETSQ